MRIIKTASVLLVVAFVSACSTTTGLPTLKGWAAFSSRPITDLAAVRESISSELKSARLQYIETKRTELSEIMNVLDKKLDELRRTADNRSNLTLFTGGAGIASGVAATTLAVASPANVVWVAGLSAFGTGVLSFQTRAALEGFSRDAVARVYNDTITRTQGTIAQIGADFEFLRQHVDSLDDSFDKRAGELDNRIVSLRSAAILTPLIIGTDQDIEELKKRNVEILKQLEETQKQVDELKKKQEGG